MKQKNSRFRYQSNPFQIAVAILCAAVLAPGNYLLLAQQADSQVMTTTSPETADTGTAADLEAPIIPADQLDSLVAPIALYPDPLLAQTLAASTYPLEIVQLQQWMEKNKDLKDKALAAAVAKQPWDASVQSMAAFPDVVTRLGDNIAWTTDLGNAFLAQQADVMAAVQRMRGKAEGTGALKTSAQQTVETQTLDNGKQAIVIQPSSPDVVYVPTYDPVVVYGAAYPSYPYPSVYYPGYVAGAALAFGTGMVLGAAWGGGWGYGCGWGHNDVNINYNNKYVNNSNKNFNQNNKWGHNPQHRGSVPYNKGAAGKYGQRPGQRPGGGAGGVGKPGGAGGIGKPGGAGGIGKPGGAGGIGKPGGAGGIGKPGGAGGVGKPGGPGGVGKPGGAGQGQRPGGGGSTKPANRPSGGAGTRPGGGASTRPATRPSGGGGNSIGGRNVSHSSSKGAFGGASGGNRSSAHASSSRGSRSMGGGGHGGGGRGGGGRRR
jgi:Protein of unknown function (DUF3300)